MEVLGFEIWREGTKLEESGYEAPLTRDEALGALQEENPLWTGKLTVKDSQLGLRGPRKLDPSKVHVLRLANLAGVSSGVLADHLAQPLPKADAATYKGNQEEEDRFQHPSRVQDWPSLPAQARAPGIRCSGLAQAADAMHELAGNAYGLDKPANLGGRAFIASEAESNRLLGRAAERVNAVLKDQSDKWNMVLTSQASIQPTASTQSAGRLTSKEGDSHKPRDTIPDFCGIRRQKIRRRHVLFTLGGKSPFQMRGVAKYGLVRLWKEVVELLSQEKSMKSAVQLVAAKSRLSLTAIRNAIHCLGQCYKNMSERGHAYGALSNYDFTWMLYADRRSKLLVSSAISCAQRSGPDCLSVTEALVFAMLSAHDEDSAGPQQPYPAAVQPGQPPHTVPPTMPKDEDMLGLQDSAVGRGAFCVPVPATASACAGSPVDGFSLADLHLGPPIARQIYHAILDGRPVVVRMGFTPRQRRHVDTEARALRAMHALQGADVPRLLAHGRMREGFAYAVTEYIDGRCWDGSSAADRSLGDQLRTGLTHIYQHGVIQNDVKPDNILVEHATGRPIFIDFALAKHSPDPEAHESEDSELHAMLGQAEPDWPVGHFSSILLLLRASD
ncbi:hypothetical protein WJX74_006385 [Apatococcus lobatus]|uniref:Protein kinase domain-containing protein n=1 Tax=Apatococcus lobatus TaxID=904363 RepID=A0AAW1S6Z4_9CHLO